MRWLATLLIPALGALPAAQATLSKPTAQTRIRPPNIVLVVMDDVGVDKVAAYGEGPAGVVAPCTPNLDALAASGVLFRNAWTNAVCSPTRAQILTGRHSFRTGIGVGIHPDGRDLGLNVEKELTIPEALLGYDTSAVGKWHLMSPKNGTKNHPLEAGFAWFSGSLFNLREAMAVDPDCGGQPLMGYTNWIKYEDPGSGELVPSCWSEYAITDNVNDAILRAQTMQEPWFLYVALHGAHSPYEAPPSSLCAQPGTCAQPYCPSASANLVEVESAIVEALDKEFGRMMTGIQAVDPAPFVFVIGDNGTPGDVSGGQSGSCYDPERGKASPYESGVRVPLLVSGPGVEPGE
jgi:arylsulfatase A-like enzyme